MRDDADGYPVGAVATMAGVSVRTLHHYDQIGLLRPSGRTSAGYRLYSEADLQRLRDALAYRELGFSLEHVAELLDDPQADTARTCASSIAWYATGSGG